MRVARLGAACADVHKCGISAASENRRSCFQPQIGGGFFRQSADLIRTVDNRRQMLGLDLVHLDKTLVPAFPALARVIQKGSKSGVRRPDDFTGTARYKIVVYVKPFTDL